jgi:hypothetical protein
MKCSGYQAPSTYLINGCCAAFANVHVKAVYGSRVSGSGGVYLYSDDTLKPYGSWQYKRDGKWSLVMESSPSQGTPLAKNVQFWTDEPSLAFLGSDTAIQRIYLIANGYRACSTSGGETAQKKEKTTASRFVRSFIHRLFHFPSPPPSCTTNE